MFSEQFTPVASLVGGCLIGLSAVMLMAFQGRIAGISGIAARLLPPYGDKATAGRAVFLIGLIVAPFCAALVFGRGDAAPSAAAMRFLRSPGCLSASVRCSAGAAPPAMASAACRGCRQGRSWQP